jgi:hypothetical protein
MSQSALIVFSNPTDGSEDEYNRWYSDVHLDEVLELPGFTAARRFELSDAQLDGYPASRHRYVAIYEIEGDAHDALARLVEALEAGRLVLPATIEVDSITPWCFAPITERVTAMAA